MVVIKFRRYDYQSRQYQETWCQPMPLSKPYTDHTYDQLLSNFKKAIHAHIHSDRRIVKEPNAGIEDSKYISVIFVGLGKDESDKFRDNDTIIDECVGQVLERNVNGNLGELSSVMAERGWKDFFTVKYYHSIIV